MFNIDGFQCFLEVDNAQTMKENREKIKKYRELMQSIVMKLGYYLLSNDNVAYFIRTKKKAIREGL